MKKEAKQKLHALDQQIAVALDDGNRAQAAGLHGQKALIYAAAFELQNAAKEVAKANALAAEEGEVETLARGYLAQGKALASDPNQRKAANDALSKAASLFATLEDPHGASVAWSDMAQLALADSNAKDALKYVGRALDAVGDDVVASAEFLRQRATIHWLHGNADAAEADLAHALQLAQQSGDETVLFKTQLLQTAINSNNDLLQTIWQQLQQRGRLDLIGDVHLQRAQAALAAEQWESAASEADLARSAARDSADFASPLRYLLGTIFLTDASEQQGDDVSVLRGWLTCRAFLTNTLGAPIGKRIDIVLDILAQRWGRPRMANAILRYQQAVAQNGKFEV